MTTARALSPSTPTTLTAAGAVSCRSIRTIDVYNAAHSADLTGGAQLLVRYTRGQGDPAANQLLWIQTVTTTDPAGGETIPYPDVYTGANAGSNLPFFFTPAETTLDPNPYVGAANIYSSSYKVNGMGPNLAYDVAIWDWPQRNATNSWRGELFLAGYDSVNNKVTVYDGMNWGFDITAKAPEPAINLLIGAGLLLFALVQRRLARRN